MPSPFPGMDFYLEQSPYWQGVHNLFIGHLTAILNDVLPDGFAANIEERVYVVMPPQSYYPDVSIVSQPLSGLLPSSEETRGGVATQIRSNPLLEEDPPRILMLRPQEVREGYIEIRPVQDDARVITAIEILSPSNKARGSEGRDAYLNKQDETIRSETHLLEIDLLRSGMHTVAAPQRALEQEGKWDYLICLHRTTRRFCYEYWMLSVRDRLPRIRIPLTAEYPDVIVNLQTIFDQVYDSGPYRRRVDYRLEPEPSLSPADRAWADTLLREKGLRP